MSSETEVSLFETLSKLRLMAAVIYDQASAQDMSEEDKEKAIAPIRAGRDDLLRKALEIDLPQVVACLRCYQDEAQMEEKRALRHKEKAQEARAHAQHLVGLMKEDLLSKGLSERIQGNAMLTLNDGKLEIR